MKAVIWTDTFQMLVIVGGMSTLVAQGSYTAGGIEKVWEVFVKTGHRFEYNK